jgi:hypothetical protein
MNASSFFVLTTDWSSVRAENVVLPAFIVQPACQGTVALATERGYPMNATSARHKRPRRSKKHTRPKFWDYAGGGPRRALRPFTTPGGEACNDAAWKQHVEALCSARSGGSWRSY